MTDINIEKREKYYNNKTMAKVQLTSKLLKFHLIY